MENFFSHPTGLVAWIARTLQCFSAVIVLGITGWAARHTKTVTVIYTLVIVCNLLLKISPSDKDLGRRDPGCSSFGNTYKLHIETL